MINLSAAASPLALDKSIYHHSFAGQCEPKDLQAAGVSQTQTYFFKDDVMWRYNHRKDESERGYPRKISRKWSGLPAGINSMFEWRGNTYFVAGDYVYRTNQLNNGIDPGYPKYIFSQFQFSTSYYSPQSGSTVLAVSEFDDGYLYIFRGSEVFRVDKQYYNLIPYGWPKSISTVFPDFPLKIDSIFYNKENDKLVYIFSGEYYYTYSSTAKKTSGPYPIKNKFKNLCLV